ncbi:hypothetical protein Tco_0412391 [Tanacetum coccineum]
MNKRKKHFANLRAEEKRRKPPTKAQKRNLMSTYLKNMGKKKYEIEQLEGAAERNQVGKKKSAVDEAQRKRKEDLPENDNKNVRLIDANETDRA